MCFRKARILFCYARYVWIGARVPRSAYLWKLPMTSSDSSLIIANATAE
jgi:hypothetical protein